MESSTVSSVNGWTGGLLKFDDARKRLYGIMISSFTLNAIIINGKETATAHPTNQRLLSNGSSIMSHSALTDDREYP